MVIFYIVDVIRVDILINFLKNFDLYLVSGY